MRLPDGYDNLFPYLMVEDAPRFLEFLRAVFDVEELGRTERDGVLANLQLRMGSVAFMASEADAMLGPIPAALYVFVEDVDAVHAKALAHGATEIFAPADMPYGDRQGGVKDPFGNVWFVSTRLVDGPYT